MYGHTRVIITEYLLINFKGALIGLFGKCPLMLARVNLRQIIEFVGNVGLRGTARFQNADAADVQVLCLDKLTLLMSEHSKSVERVSRLHAGCAEVALRKMQRLLQGRLRPWEVARADTCATEFQQ